MASMLRAALSCGRRLPYRQRAPTPCRAAAAAADLVNRTSPARDVPEGLLRSPQEPPPAPGRAKKIYRPDLKLACSQRMMSTAINYEKPNLVVLTQIDFFQSDDMNVAEWMDPKSFLEKHPAILEAWRHNRMIPSCSIRPWMLSGIGRNLWHSAVQLVVFNKLRGHDIASGLVESNLRVSPYGSFALIEPIALPYDGKTPFRGYEALHDLFLRIMQQIYGMAVMSMLTLDVQHFLDILLQIPVDDRLPLYHAVFLSPSGRAMLSIRLHCLVRFEVNMEGFSVDKKEIHDLLQKLPDVSSDPKEELTDNMHILFRCLRQHGQMRKSQGPSQAPPKQHAGPQDLDEEEKRKVRITSGLSIVGINRNAVLHRVLRKAVDKLAEEERKAGKFLNAQSHVKSWYYLWEVVQVLQFYMPLHLPKAQELAMNKNLWSYLEVGSLWPKDEIFHFMTVKRIGPTPYMSRMFTYRSRLAVLDKNDSNEGLNNSRIFIGGLGPSISEQDLVRVFGSHGMLVYVKIPYGKKYGFVEYATRASAEEAIQGLNGIDLGCGPIRVQFAHSPPIKGPLLGGHYAHPQTYDNYVWAMTVLERDKKKQ